MSSCKAVVSWEQSGAHIPHPSRTELHLLFLQQETVKVSRWDRCLLDTSSSFRPIILHAECANPGSLEALTFKQCDLLPPGITAVYLPLNIFSMLQNLEHLDNCIHQPKSLGDHNSREGLWHLASATVTVISSLLYHCSCCALDFVFI